MSEQPERPKCVECHELPVVFESLQLCGYCALKGGHLQLTEEGRKALARLTAN